MEIKQVTYILFICILNYNIVWCSDKVLFLQEYLKLHNETKTFEAYLGWKQGNVQTREQFRTLPEKFRQCAVYLEKLKFDETTDFAGEYKQLLDVLSKSYFRYVLPGLKSCFIQHEINNRLFVTDMTYTYFDSLIKMALEHYLYAFPNKWIIFGNYQELKKKNYYFPINSYIIVVEETNSNNFFEIHTLYKLNLTVSKYTESTLGKWSRNQGFWFYNKLLLPQNRSNFMRMPLKVSYIFLDNSSLLHLRDNRNEHLDKLTKLNFLLFQHFVDIWNMSQKIIIRSDWGFEPHPTKLYHKGMLGDLYYGRADISGTLSFTPVERLKYFKYLVATVNGLALTFIFRAPPLAYTTNMFALPFDKYVWISCGIVVVLCCCVIRIILRWEETEDSLVEIREEANENAPSFLDVAMMQIAVVCQMDYYYEPKSSSGKIATFTLLLTFSYIYTAFSARIVLLLQSYANNLRDVRGLYDAKMDMGVEDIPYNRYYFTRPAKRTNEELRKLLYYNKIAPKGLKERYYNAQDGISLVQKSYFAFHMEMTTANNLMEALFTNEEKCSVRIVESIVKTDLAHLSCPKNSTYTEYFLIGFRRLTETGVLEREHRKKFKKTPPKCVGQGSIFVSVGLVECYFAFQCFIIGMALSIFIFFMELISHIYLKNRKLSKNILITPF